jgi:predicted phosphoribosyltransferase
MIYPDRASAGRFLAHKLRRYANRDDVIVLALPRGGVPVAFEIASSLEAPLDVFFVRKLGVPGYEELAMGAIASGGVRVINTDVVDYMNISPSVIQSVSEVEWEELKRREIAYRGNRDQPQIAGKVVILADDGLATGTTMRAAVEAVRQESPLKVVVVVPVSSAHACDKNWLGADEIFCGATPDPFHEVGRWFDDFKQVTDEEVRTLLHEASELKMHDLVEV